ncbi:LacI family DNA-binding transcriptional regulator [Alkalibacter saccharofermentans]|nr:LacI family DNA-binding transcriptional regulator [Alkalibacter saccharofermentans]
MATIKDIAKMAGVSVTTVSHVVNKTRYVSPELVKRVEDVIRTMDNPPNFVLRKEKNGSALTTKMKYVVFLTGEEKTPLQNQVEKYIRRYIGEKGYTLVSLCYDEESEKLELYSQTLLSVENAVGLIVFPVKESERLEKILRIVKVPILFINDVIESIHADAVISDDYNGAYRATNYLIKGGHENIVILSSSENDYVERIEGYKKALQDNGIKEESEYIFLGKETKQEVYEAIKTFQKYDNKPTALILSDYKVVVSVLKYFDEYNIACPKDLSIISCDDFEWAKLHSPAITTVEPKVKEIAERASSILLKRVQKNLFENNTKMSLVTVPEIIVLPTMLHVRDSTRGIGRGPFGEKAASIESLYLTDDERKKVQTGNYTAAISFHYTGTAWSRLHEKGIKDEFNSLGISLLAVTDAHFDPVMQSKQLESLVTLEPDVIISIPTDPTRTADAYKKIIQSKSRLVLITNVPDGLKPGDYVTCISVNEHSYGRSIGHGLGEYMRQFNKTNVGMINYGMDFYATNQRDNAAEQIILEEYPELVVCGKVSFDNEEQVKEKTVELMNAHPDIGGIYVSWGGPAMSAVEALLEMGRTDVVLATGDLEFDLALNMAKGGMVKAIGAQRPYEQGQAMALAAANSLLGKEVPSFVGLEPLYVTRENILKTWKIIFKEMPPRELIDFLEV